MKQFVCTGALLVAVCSFLTAQTGSINNTLGTGGSFSIKDASNDMFLSLSQSNGYLSLSNSLSLPVTSGGTVGVIFKGADRFIHDYAAPGAGGINTFVGINSGNFTMGSTAYSNTGVGSGTLFSVTSGNENCAFGQNSLAANTSGQINCAFGVGTLGTVTSGYGNSAFGNRALNFATGSINCAYGATALYYDSTGTENCAFGSQAGYNLYGGTNDILIGFDAEPSTSTVSNEITLGNGSITSLRCNVQSISSLSDARDKRNIKNLPLGIDFLMSIRPRLYNWDRREWYKNGKPNGSKMQKTPTAGFVAQELDAAQTNAHAEWLNLVLKTNPKRLEATPGNLLPVMVKAIQDLKHENDELKRELSVLRSSIAQQVKAEVRKAITQSGTTRVSLKNSGD